jgi:hypothetical protein
LKYYNEFIFRQLIINPHSLSAARKLLAYDLRYSRL